MLSSGSARARLLAMSLIFLVLGCLAIGIAVHQHPHLAILAGGILIGFIFALGRSIQSLQAVQECRIGSGVIFLPVRSRAPTVALDLPLRI